MSLQSEREHKPCSLTHSARVEHRDFPATAMLVYQRVWCLLRLVLLWGENYAFSLRVYFKKKLHESFYIER